LLSHGLVPQVRADLRPRAPPICREVAPQLHATDQQDGVRAWTHRDVECSPGRHGRLPWQDESRAVRDKAARQSSVVLTKAWSQASWETLKHRSLRSSYRQTKPSSAKSGRVIRCGGQAARGTPPGCGLQPDCSPMASSDRWLLPSHLSSQVSSRISAHCDDANTLHGRAATDDGPGGVAGHPSIGKRGNEFPRHRAQRQS
jgi:hypothetical protein